MSVISHLSDKSFVIHLAHRTEREESFRRELAAIGHTDYEIFNAYGVDNLPPRRYSSWIQNFKMTGFYGNKFSHYGVIEKAKTDGLKAVTVFEDDVMFHPYFKEVVSEALGQLGRDWDWLQFGGNHRFFAAENPGNSPIDGMPYPRLNDGLIQITPNLARVIKMLTAHCYIVKESIYDFILRHAIASPMSIDGFYAHEVHPRFNCYCVTPCMTSQRPGANDIGGGMADNRWYIGD